MELIDRYVAKVGSYLPEKTRPDIEKELRSILEDMLEDRAQAAGQPAGEELAVALLQEYGEPSQVAAAYHAPRYVVGPALYPTFIMVIRIVAAVLAVLAVIQFGFGVARSGQNFGQIGAAFLEGFSTLFSGLLTSFGIVTFIFALIERFNPDLKLDKQAWNPRDLKPAAKPASRVSVSDLVVSIVFNLIAILVFNLYFERIGMYVYENGVWAMIPLFSEVLRGYVPYFTLLWGLEIALNSYVLQAGRWEISTRWLAAAHSAATAVLLLIVLAGPDIAVPAQQMLAAWPQAAADAMQVAQVDKAVELGARTVVAIVLIVSLIELGKQAWKLFQGRE